jgi:hypothetical protein
MGGDGRTGGCCDAEALTGETARKGETECIDAGCKEGADGTQLCGGVVAGGEFRWRLQQSLVICGSLAQHAWERVREPMLQHSPMGARKHANRIAARNALAPRCIA